MSLHNNKAILLSRSALSHPANEYATHLHYQHITHLVMTLLAGKALVHLYCIALSHSGNEYATLLSAQHT